MKEKRLKNEKDFMTVFSPLVSFFLLCLSFPYNYRREKKKRILPQGKAWIGNFYFFCLENITNCIQRECMPFLIFKKYSSTSVNNKSTGLIG